MKAKYTICKTSALIGGLALLIQTVFPTGAYALTSGPSQPEFSSFEQVGATDMVDLFTGDFSYNLPLLEVPGPRGGYPINLFYQSVTNVEQEASMVGLGWNIGVGAIQRNLKGLPDDFNGENLRHKKDRKNNTTVSLSATGGVELAPADGSIAPDLLLSSNLQISYNNYKGPGLQLGFGAQLKLGESELIRPSFNTSFSSFDGVDYSLGISLAHDDIPDPLAGLSLGFNTMTGAKTFNTSFMGTHSLPNPSTFFPSLSTERVSNSASIRVKAGGEFFTVEGFIGTGGAFHSERLRYKNRWRNTKMYGSLYLSEGQQDSEGILDFSRQNDKPLFVGNENLPVPTSGEDFYTVSGHGMSGTFRLFRDDIGIYGDRSFEVKSGGGSAGLEAAGGNAFRVGADVTANLIKETNEYQNTGAFSNQDLHFRAKDRTGNDEPYYFDFLYSGGGQIIGDPTAGHLNRDYNEIGLNQVLSLPEGSLFSPPVLRNENGSAVLPQGQLTSSVQARSRPIQHFTNNQLVYPNAGGLQLSVVPHFNLFIYEDLTSPTTILDNLKPIRHIRQHNDQVGAFSITDASGMRWHYGLPVMNTYQQEATFSVGSVQDERTTCTPIYDFIQNENAPCEDRRIDHKVGIQGSEDYLDIREMPSYAHSYMLSSLVSHDYIDYDPSDGPPNANDYGHWVRFEYVRTHDEDQPYKWRTPYFGAEFNSGLQSLDEDNKAFFTYGEREQYYPYRIYTSSHYAQFFYSQRGDARGISCSLPARDPSAYGAYSYQLDSIQLFEYSLSEINQERRGSLVKTVVFDYKNPLNNGRDELCTGLLNHGDRGGKLTLHQVWIKNYNSGRGRLTPYLFEYNDEGFTTKTYSNRYRADRWGVFSSPYRPQCSNRYAPYTEQTHPDGLEALEDEQASNVRSWHIKSIRLPSGAKIEVDVGRDHYAHVQNRVATQMTKVTGFANNNQSRIPVSSNTSGDDFKVFFELNEPISTSIPNEDKEYLLRQYFDDLVIDDEGRQLVFQIESEMIPNTGFFERLEGLCYLSSGDLIFENDIGLVGSSDDHTHGWVRVQPLSERIKGNRYHPMLVSAWQFNKLHLRPRMGAVRNIFAEGDDGVFEKLLGVASRIPSLFRDYYRTCINRRYGSEVDLSRSFIRLNHPTKRKYGGGVRVNQISISNIWNEEDSPPYGNVYSYETEREVTLPSGVSILVNESNGVAINEPTIGGIETAFRYYEQYTQQVKNSSDNIYLDHHPFNQDYLSGGSVGYSEVVVRSLASEYHYQKHRGQTDLLPNGIDPNLSVDGIASTGEVRHQFYTAKDYPVIYDKSILKERSNSPAFRIKLFIGGFSDEFYRASQGFSIELNDMHGKPKATYHYAQSKDGRIGDELVSATEYEYLDNQEEFYNARQKYSRRKLTNEVDLILSHKDESDVTMADRRRGELGVQRQVFCDARRTQYSSSTVGAAAQVHGFYIPPFFFPVFPTVIPSISKSQSDVQTAVVNKVIYRKGIISKVNTFDGQSKREAENLAFDPYTGRALLQKVNTLYDQPQYEYEIPAHDIYDRMGPAYRNNSQTLRYIGGKNATLQNISSSCAGYYEVPTFSWSSANIDLVQGDEYIVGISNGSDNSIDHLSRWTYMYTLSDHHHFHIYDRGSFEAAVESQPDNQFVILDFKLLRSGRRNQLNLPAQKITTLSDPTLPSSLASKNWEYEHCDGTANGSLDVVEKSDVLEGMAYTYDEVWHFMNHCVNDSACAPYEVNDFLRGNLGIFRPKDQARFNAPRLNNSIEDRGTLSSFHRFNWDEGNIFNLTDKHRWIRTGGMTQYYLMGHPKESIDQFGNRTAYRLTSLSGNLTSSGRLPLTRFGQLSGQLQNCGYLEGGMSTFENATNGGNNFNNFGHVIEWIDNFGSFGYFGAYEVEHTDGSSLYLNKPPSTQRDASSILVFELSNDQKLIVKDNTIGDALANCNTSTKMDVALEACLTGTGLDVSTLLSSGQVTRVIMDDETASQRGRGDQAVSIFGNGTAGPENAHSGRNWLRTSGSDPEISLRTLKPDPSKSYYIGLWIGAGSNSNGVSQDVTAEVFAENDLGGEVSLGNLNLVDEQTQMTDRDGFGTPYQKMEAVLQFPFQPTKIQLDRTGLRIEDLVVLPLDASCMVQIQDFAYIRPHQMIDETGYLTRYGYDDEGQLIKIDKETAEGVMTIQEKRKFISPNPN